MVRTLLVGNVAPQADAVYKVMGGPWVKTETVLRTVVQRLRPDLIVVAGWRRLIPPDVLAVPRLGVVGFHSAKLPEYPGRAPIPWTLLRGDTHAYNTMLYLDEGVDSGDIIDAERRRIEPDDTPDSLYRWVAQSDVRLLTKHLPALLAGTAPRTPQNLSRRGPLTTADGWSRLEARHALDINTGRVG